MTARLRFSGRLNPRLATAMYPPHLCDRVKQMQLALKLKKLGSGLALRSAQRHLRQSPLLRRQTTVPLDPESLTAAVEGEEFEVIRQRHAVQNPGVDWPKYFDLPKWMRVNLKRVRDLGLDWGFRKRILDLGCGAGYFLFIAQCLGHEVLGLDIDEIPMFGEMMLTLGTGRVVWQIRPSVRLPKLGKKFDLITAFMICFNGHKSVALWDRRSGNFSSTTSRPISRHTAAFVWASTGKMTADFTVKSCGTTSSVAAPDWKKTAPFFPADRSPGKICLTRLNALREE